MAKAPKDTANTTIDAGPDVGDLGSVLDIGMDIAGAEQPDLLPAAEYVAEVRSAEVKVSGAGNKYIAVAFYIPTEEYPADFDVTNAPDGLTLTWNRVPVPENNDRRAAFRLRKFMETIEAPFEGSRLDLEKWTGLKARVRIKHGSWEGVNREEIASVAKDV